MRLIIDTDAGVDDAQALMMAIAYPTAKVEAITTVTGNIEVEHVNQNVFTVLDVMQADIPVYAGATLPLVDQWTWTTELFHGRDGMGDWPERPPSSRQLATGHAVEAMVRLVNESPGDMTIVALGPLTNLALATRLDPQFPAKVKQLIFMGGTIAANGNTDILSAEFNFRCDPEAAHIVFSSFVESSMLSWETTLEHPVPWPQYEKLLELTTSQARFFSGINAAMNAYLLEHYAEPTYLIPDPLAMAVALEPELILQSERYFASVELHGMLTRGQVVFDFHNRLKLPPNVNIIKKIDIDGVVRLYRQMLGAGND